jgi:hypothetical protein
VDRGDVRELHYIAPIENIPSILRLGVLSHRGAANIPHMSVANSDVQFRRSGINVPESGGRRLHEYANLYFDARNPMMMSLQQSHQDLCVLRVRSSVLDLPRVKVTDMNASKENALFYSASDGIQRIDRRIVLSKRWYSDEYKAKKQAEVLVPDQVPPAFIAGAFVSCEPARVRVAALTPDDLFIEVKPGLFLF